MSLRWMSRWAEGAAPLFDMAQVIEQDWLLRQNFRANFWALQFRQTADTSQTVGFQKIYFLLLNLNLFCLHSNGSFRHTLQIAKQQGF